MIQVNSAVTTGRTQEPRAEETAGHQPAEGPQRSLMQAYDTDHNNRYCCIVSEPTAGRRRGGV